MADKERGGLSRPEHTSYTEAAPSKGTEPLTPEAWSFIPDLCGGFMRSPTGDKWYPEGHEHQCVAALRARLSEAEAEADTAAKAFLTRTGERDAAEVRASEAEAERDRLKAGRITCRCGKDTASIKNARCYNCRNRPHWDLDAAEARAAQLEQAAPSTDRAEAGGEAIEPTVAAKILDYLPQPCGGATCREERCAELARLRANVEGAADLYRRLVQSYENKVQDLAKETLALDAAQAKVKALETAHFDTYEGMAPVGCKYCPCRKWQDTEGE